MPKTPAPSSNALFGFFWWFHMWGHSVVDPLWSWVSRVSIWNDLEDMVTDLPWYFGMVFWWAPVVFFTLLSFMGFYAMAFAGFWFWGFVALAAGKFLGAGWIRYGQKVMHSVLTGTPWYDKQFKAWSGSKRAGLNAFRATGLSKSVGGVTYSMGKTVSNVIILVAWLLC